MPKIKHIATGDVIDVSEPPVYQAGIWECGSQRFTDVGGAEYEVVPDPPAVPQSVTRFQALAALEMAGLLDIVEATMAAPETPKITKLAWGNALAFERNSPTISAMASVLGMTDAQIDELFIAADGIVA